jgi:NitT/TauT family transport system ATP-binding protein
VFITHSINEAMQVGDRVLVFHRPARIAYEATDMRDASEARRQEVNGRILEVLATSQ